MDAHKFRYVDGSGKAWVKDVPSINMGDSVDDPTTWLNDGKRPKLTIPKAKSNMLKTVCKYFASQSASPENIEPDVALYLLYHLSVKYIKVDIKNKLTLKKNIYLNSGLKTVEDLFDVEEGEELKLSGDNETSDKEMPELEILSALLANYRICGMASNADQKYVQTLKARMNRTFVQKQIIKEEIQENFYNALTWVNNYNYTRLCAGIDLLLFSDKNHPYSALRMATQSSKFKDCALIGEINHFLTTLSEAPMDAWEHALEQSISKEIINIMTCLGRGFEGEYANYAKEMGAMDKSPFSVTANPNLHNWMHMICAMLSSERSMNARLASGNQHTVFLTALACAYTYRSKTKIQAVIYKDDHDSHARSINESTDDQIGMLETAENLKALRDDGEEAAEIWEWFNNKKTIISDERPGTIGSYLISKMH